MRDDVDVESRGELCVTEEPASKNTHAAMAHSMMWKNKTENTAAKCRKDLPARVGHLADLSFFIIIIQGPSWT